MVRISKQQECQKYIFKIHSSRLRKERWNLTLPLEEARRNDEIISLASSQMLRWIAELNGVEDADERARAIKGEIKSLRKQSNTPQIKRQIRKLYKDLDELQFQPDYMSLVIDKEKDYWRACKGFSINGVRYKRLLGTNGGIKNSTIVFVSERLHDELDRRINNDRDTTKEFVTAKLEAYKALTCSASIPVSMPHGVCVVDDAETEFFEDIIYLSDEEDGEPIMRNADHELIKMDASDGFGLMLPSLAQRWSEELHLDYVMSGCNTRNSFEKGMVYTFDFLDFAENVAGQYIIHDAWGNKVDLRSIELVLTTSMVKLWDSYFSCDDYLEKSAKNGYTFAITKTCPKNLENERDCNYQYLNPFAWITDDDIDELIKPTLSEIRDVLSGDWRKSLLFLRGAGITADNVENAPDDFIKSIMIDQTMINDPYIQSTIYGLIKNRIDEAKVGVLKVHGNYSICSGDPYTLCQSMFGMEKTGLLKAGEIYNRYWVDSGSEDLLCFRSPMSSANNIKMVHPVHNDEIDYWYQHMTTCTIFNSWDTIAAALNGMDFDGDLVFLTDNEVLVRNFRPKRTLMCLQKKAIKKVPTEEDFITTNISGFGNEIGQITNWITSMFDIQSGYTEDSDEYKTLEYRIQAGQQYQQNSIDSIKGIVANPMPRSWHDRHSANKIEDESSRTLYRNIVAEKKPYYMQYIYPALRKEYRTYTKRADRNALREFQMTVDELIVLPEKTERQEEFLKHYYFHLPVGIGDCVTNRICRRFEQEFDGYIGKHNADTKFDYTIMKSGVEYSQSKFYQIKNLYDEYNKRLQSYAIKSEYERVDEYDALSDITIINNEFQRECAEICPDKFMLCDIVLDLCYKRSSTKRFAWNMCGKEIIENLLNKNNRTISFPTICSHGEIEYGGERFTIEQKVIEVNNDNIERD